MSDLSDESPLMAPPPMADPSEIDLEAGPADQIQCRICLETDGIFNFQTLICLISLSNLKTFSELYPFCLFLLHLKNSRSTL